MALFIRETYSLSAQPEKWGFVLQQAVNQFYAANGVLPNWLGLHGELYELFPTVVGLLGFNTVSTGLKKEVEDKLEQMGELEDILGLPMTLVISPEDDYRLVCLESDEVTLNQFQLGHMDGSKQTVN
jgi:hypothetical protein